MFSKNGTDATTQALMVARAATGRTKVLMAHGSYHGADPWCTPSLSGTTPNERADLIEYTYNDLASAEAAAAQAEGDVAAIIVTPFKHDSFEDQELAAGEFARGLRALADRIGAALVIDDVRGGWRLDLRRLLGDPGRPPRPLRLQQGHGQRLPDRRGHRRGLAPRARPRRSTPPARSGSTPPRWPPPRPPSRPCATSAASP